MATRFLLALGMSLATVAAGHFVHDNALDEE